MPWNSQGGGPWGSGKGRWGSEPQSSGPTPPDLEELLRRGQDKLRTVLPGGSFGGAVFVQKLAPGPPWAKRIHTVHRRCRKFQLGKCGVRGLLISMTDYYPLSPRAVADLEENTGETRLALLQRVRTVLVNELRTLTPPLTES